MKAAAPRCQLLLILLMSVVMLLPGTNGSLLLVQRTVTRTIVLQETIGKAHVEAKISFQGDSVLLSTCATIPVNCSWEFDSVCSGRRASFLALHYLSYTIPEKSDLGTEQDVSVLEPFNRLETIVLCLKSK
ncbi:hypothetical protein STEG23_008725, partial [Scotinomys teguina]